MAPYGCHMSVEDMRACKDASLSNSPHGPGSVSGKSNFQILVDLLTSKAATDGTNNFVGKIANGIHARSQNYVRSQINGIEVEWTAVGPQAKNMNPTPEDIAKKAAEKRKSNILIATVCSVLALAFVMRFCLGRCFFPCFYDESPLQKQRRENEAFEERRARREDDALRKQKKMQKAKAKAKEKAEKLERAKLEKEIAEAERKFYEERSQDRANRSLRWKTLKKWAGLSTGSGERGRGGDEWAGNGEKAAEKDVEAEAADVQAMRGLSITPMRDWTISLQPSHFRWTPNYTPKRSYWQSLKKMAGMESAAERARFTPIEWDENALWTDHTKLAMPDAVHK